MHRYDREVIKGGFAAASRIQVVSLEVMDVQDRSKLLYLGQPTLDDVRAVMKDAGWTFVRLAGNKAAAGEVKAFFVHDHQYTSKVDFFAVLEREEHLNMNKV